MRIIFKDWSLPGFTAHTVPPIGIYINRNKWKELNHDQRRRLIRHEIQHWKQFEKMGLILFYVNYFGMLFQHGYKDHPMEKEAREAEGDPFNNPIDF